MRYYIRQKAQAERDARQAIKTAINDARETTLMMVENTAEIKTQTAHSSTDTPGNHHDLGPLLLPPGLPVYYNRNGIAILCGDCREILPQLGTVESVITDPVWPDADVKLAGSENPYELFAQMCQVIPQGTERLVVQLGCDSDPRFLQGVPGKWPFLRYCWLDYARPSYKGRLLYTGDVAFIFGIPPAYIKGRQVMGGMCRSTKADSMFQRGTGSIHGKSWTRNEMDNLPHPCARRLQHVAWLVYMFTDKAVCDPFMGSGTTAVACKMQGRKFIGIEIEERFCDLSVKRIEKAQYGVQSELLPR